MTAPVVPWGITADERRIRKALMALSPEERAICIAVGDGYNIHPEEPTQRALEALRRAFEEAS